MHPASSFLSLSRTRCHSDEASKKRVFETAASLIAEDQAYLRQSEVFAALINRERLGSTAMGDGIAIPHCRVANCPAPLGALLTLNQAVDFDAIDKQPVDIVFVLLVPEEQNQEHLQLLANLARVLREEKNRLALREATSAEDLYQSAVALLEQSNPGC